MFGLPAWLLVIPVLAFLIFIHELGHFVTAKWFGIKVTEFGFGFPPRIFGVRRGETTYSINLIPLGGFVKMVGEEDPTEPRSFARQSVLKRVVVLCAGPLMNLIFPLVMLTILFTVPQDTVVGSVTINGVAPRSPAAEAGLRPGDTILSVNGRKVDNHVELIQRIMVKLGSSTELTIRRGSLGSGFQDSIEFAPVEIVTVIPRLNPPNLTVVEEVTDPEKEVSLAETRRYDASLQIGDTLTQGAVGVIIGTANPRIVKESHPVWNSVPLATVRIWEVLVISKNGVVRWAAGGPDPGVTGPVGIAQVTGEVARAGVWPLFELMALISISLGILNILPIPALDGGRLLFVLIEWVRRGKRISARREGLVHMAGFVILIGFIVIMSYRDIARILNGESFIR